MANSIVMPEKFHFLEVKIATPSILPSIMSIKDKAFQRKLDGTAVETFIGYYNYDVRIFGRGVLEYGIASEYSSRFPEVINEIIRLNIPKKTNFVGELIIIDSNSGFESLKLVAGRTQRGRNISLYSKLYPASLIILDVVEVGGKDVTTLNYLDRINFLKSSVENWDSDRVFFIKNESELDWNFIEKNKLEGVVVRDLNAKYNKGIWKIKLVYTEDVYCKGEYNKSDSMKEFASLICYQLTKDGKEVYVADVGGGFSYDERKEIQKMLDEGLLKEKPLVLEIKTFGRTDSMKFRGPIHIRKRYDKPWNQCLINE